LVGNCRQRCADTSADAQNGRVGSYASLSIAGYELFSTKSYVDPVAMSVFTERDRHVVIVPEDPDPSSQAEAISGDSGDTELFDDSDDVTVQISYRASSRVIAERLEAMGISLAQVRAAFERRLQERADEIAAANDDDEVPRAAVAEMLREATFHDWSAAFQEFMADNIHPTWPSVAPRELRTEMMRFIAEESEDGAFFGLPGDARWLLRAATEVCGPDALVVYDITELVGGGWYKVDEPVAEEAIASLRRGARHNAPTIILTEGSTDAAALESAMRLLAPHLVGYLTFLDFHSANAAGGTGPLISTVRAFAGAGVMNRTLALFDNDTAGRSAVRALERTRLPESMRIATLPDLELGRKYPTIGPTGEAVQDVNGRAASLELYFGEDVLRRENGELTPVAWQSRDPAVGDWQGELQDKSLLQNRFAEKVQRATTNPELLEALDWTGMRQIIERALYAFSEPDPPGSPSPSSSGAESETFCPRS
jgi:hypothetical protein